MNYSFTKDTCEYLLSVLKDDDIVTVSGKDMIDLINSGKTFSGRKPIAIDLPLFDEVITRWHNNEITAREAMKLLDLKPNTFYRRVKERTESSMKNIIEGISDAKEIIKEETKDLRKDIHGISKQLYSDAKDARQVVDEKLKVMNVEREMLFDKIDAEISRRTEINELKEEVEKETQNQKSLNK